MIIDWKGERFTPEVFKAAIEAVPLRFRRVVHAFRFYAAADVILTYRCFLSARQRSAIAIDFWEDYEDPNFALSAYGVMIYPMKLAGKIADSALQKHGTLVFKLPHEGFEAESGYGLASAVVNIQTDKEWQSTQ